MTVIIDNFRGNWGRLSNFWQQIITIEGLTYNSSEAAYQAFKALDKEDRTLFLALRPAEAKKLGRSLLMRSDWNEVKYDTMKMILRIKFSEPRLRDFLLSTGDIPLIEGNTWHDNQWGDCHCGRKACEIKGKNMLGKVLMEVRKELKENDDNN